MSTRDYLSWLLSFLCAVTRSCRTLCDPVDCSLPGSSVCGIFQAKILEWVAISSSRRSLWPGIKPMSLVSPSLAGKFFSISATWEVFWGGSDSKALAYNAGDPGSIPRSGRSPGEGNGNHSSTPAWKIPWTEEPGGLRSMGSQRVGLPTRLSSFAFTSLRLHTQGKTSPLWLWPSCSLHSEKRGEQPEHQSHSPATE